MGEIAGADALRAVLEDVAPRYFLVRAQRLWPGASSDDDPQGTQRQLWRTLDDAVRRVAAAVEDRNPASAGHGARVAALAAAVATRIGLDLDTAEGIHVAGLLHDVGMLEVPSELLGRADRLTPGEQEVVQRHTTAGHDVLAGIRFPWPVARMVLEHHERVDGSGPHALGADDLLVASRILAVADAFDAACSARPGPWARRAADALESLSQGRGTLFDADAVDACAAVLADDPGRWRVPGPSH